jgi:hypothetical protein
LQARAERFQNEAELPWSASPGYSAVAAHYAAILAGRTKTEIERATAFGFFFGIGLGSLVLLTDSLT